MAKEGRHATFVALSDQRPVGMTAAVIQNVFEQDEPIGRIIALSVDSDFQRTGLGTALIKEAERWIRLQGGSMVLVNSGYHRNDAHQFYEYAGYVAKGTSFRKTL